MNNEESKPQENHTAVTTQPLPDELHFDLGNNDRLALYRLGNELLVMHRNSITEAPTFWKTEVVRTADQIVQDAENTKKSWAFKEKLDEMKSQGKSDLEIRALLPFKSE